MLRILLAATLASLSVGATLAAAIVLDLSAPVALAMCVLSILGSIWLADRGRFPQGRSPSLDEMARAGLLEEIAFTAGRAFAVDESEDEGPHYFIELLDGAVLYLRGQYLDDYGPDVADSRRFPCTSFRLVRHKPSGEFVDVHCDGAPLEPETTLPPFPSEYFLNDALFADGQIIADRSFDALKSEIATLGRAN